MGNKDNEKKFSGRLYMSAYVKRNKNYFNIMYDDWTRQEMVAKNTIKPYKKKK